MNKLRTTIILTSALLIVLIFSGFSAASNSSSSIPVALEGKITKEPVQVNDSLVMGTEEGLYVFSKDGDLESYIGSPPVRDFAFIGEDRVIVLLEEEYFPNIKCYDLSSGETIWSRSHTTEIYSPDLGYVNRQVQPFDVKILGDVDADGVKDVVLSAGHSLLTLSGKNGEEIWEVSHNYNFWKVKRIGERIFAGTQDGYLFSMEASSGEVLYKKKLAESFQHGDFGSVERSVWDIGQVTMANGSTRAAVTTEDGRVFLINPEGGDISWERKIVNYNKEILKNYYFGRGGGGREVFPTVPGDANFFNLDLRIVEDVSGDGSEDLAVAVSPETNPEGRRYEGSTQALYLLNSSSGGNVWEPNKAVSFGQAGNFTYSPNVDGGALLIPQGTTGKSQGISVIGLESGDQENSLKIESIPSGTERDKGFGLSYLRNFGEDFALVSDSRDLIVFDGDGSIIWDFPRIRDASVMSGNFSDNATTDYLLYSNNYRGESQTKSRSLALRSGENGSFVWSRILSRKDYFENSGFSKITKIESVSGGDRSDILAFRQVGRETWEEVESGKEPEVPPPKILIISGEDGSIVDEFTLVNTSNDHFRSQEGQYFWITSVDVVSDVNGNGSSDIIVGSRGRVFILDARTGDLLWERIYRGGEEAPSSMSWDWIEDWEASYLSVGDLNDDGYSDLLATSGEGKLIVLESDVVGGDLKYSITVEKSFEGWIDRRNVRTLEDLDGDGSEEVLFKLDSESQDTVFKVFSPGRGKTLTTIRRPWRVSLSWKSGDFNGNGTDGSLIFQMETKGGPRLSVIDGSEEIWSYEYTDRWLLESLGYTRVMPADSAGDINGDGSEEIALAKCTESEGAKIDIYNLKNGKLVKTIILEEYETESEREIPGILVKRLSDLTGDGSPELGVAVMVGSADRKKVKFFAVDPQNGEVLAGYESKIKHILSFKNGLGLLASDGGLNLIDVTQGVSLSTPEGNSPLRLEWNSERQSVTTVLVNDRPVALTTETSTTVRLPPGEHEIKIRSTDQKGVSVYDSVEVDVGGGSSLNLGIYVITAVLFIVFFLPSILRRIQR